MSAWHLGIIISLGIGSFFVALENGTVILLVVLKRRLRTFTNGFVVSLAVSDFLVGSIFMPTYLSNPGLTANGYVIAMLLYSNVGNICAVTTERYIAVLKPLKYQVIMTKYFTRMIIVSWLIPIIISLLPLFWSFTDIAHKIYIGFLLIFCTLVPCIYMLITYCLIMREARRQLRRIDSHEILSNGGGSPRLISRRTIREWKVARIFAAIALIFMAAWVPTGYMTIAFSLLHKPEVIPDWLPILSIYLIVLSALSNPNIYAFYKTDFKDAFKNIVRKHILRNSDRTGDLTSIEMYGSGNHSSHSGN